jgi:agarase
MKTSVVLTQILMFLCALILLAFTIPIFAQDSFFRAENRDGIWWIIDPRGLPTLSLGVDNISYESDRVRGTGACPYCETLGKIYPERNAWGLEALARIRQWGFNTIGAWSDPILWTHGVAYTVILDIAARAGADWQQRRPADYFDKRFEKAATDIAGKMCQPRRFDHMLLGYFSDNELRWGPDWGGKETLLEMYLKLPAGAAGRLKASEFLRERYGNEIGKLNQAWGVKAPSFEELPAPAATGAYISDAAQFLEILADRYFEVCERAIHAADPNHLYLGARFAGLPPEAALRGARHADVVSINVYAFDPRPAIETVFQATGRPVMVTEFAFRAQNSGLPNTQGAGPKVPDQAARAQAYADYVTRLESLPEAVGYHWFEWVDEPREGRFDGENSNYGLVDIGDFPYEEFIVAVKKANALALEAHQHAAQP